MAMESDTEAATPIRGAADEQGNAGSGGRQSSSMADPLSPSRQQEGSPLNRSGLHSTASPLSRRRQRESLPPLERHAFASQAFSANAPPPRLHSRPCRLGVSLLCVCSCLAGIVSGKQFASRRRRRHGRRGSGKRGLALRLYAPSHPPSALRPRRHRRHGKRVLDAGQRNAKAP